MKRRTLLYGGGIAAAAATGGALLWKPRDQGAPHDGYFSALNALLKRVGPGRPVMILDLDRINRNVDVLASSVGRGKTYHPFSASATIAR